MGRFWAEQPPGRVVRLVGANPEAIELALEPLPDDAPAVVTCRPHPEPDPARTVAAVLDELERAAVGLFPAWLPDAETLDGRHGAQVAAVRALATRKGAATAHFGPFLTDLAGRSLGGGSGGPPGNGRFPAEVRAAGLARVVADSYARPGAALLVHAPDRLTGRPEQGLLAACEWLAYRGGFAVWLTGPGLCEVDRLPAVDVVLPGHLAGLPEVSPAAPEAAVVSVPPPAGRPHPGSPTERALESALTGRPWAQNRAWNRTIQVDVLTNPVRVDLIWEDAGCVVEIDGPEHRSGPRYDADRRRDVMLQLAGFAVLRYTNEQVAQDLGTVLSQLEQMVTTRRGKDRHARR